MLQHFIRIFVDGDGSIKADCCHYNEAGTQIGSDPIEVDQVMADKILGLEPAPEPKARPAPAPKTATKPSKAKEK